MPQSQVFKETIDGVEYRMRPLPPRVGLKLAKRLLTIAAPGVGNAIDAVDGDIADLMKSKIKDIGLGGMLTGVLDRMDDRDLDWFNDTLAAQCEVVKGPNEAPRLSDIFDVHFQGRIRHWVSWAVWATKHQFADFFDDSAPNDSPPA